MFHQHQPNPTVASQLADVLSDGGWRSKARPAQLPPPGSWALWILLAGRGFGKTWVGSSYINELAETGRAKRIGLIAGTAGDARDVMIEGESGILNTAPSWCRPLYEPSKRRLTWPNGAIATAYSSEEADRLRGPQHDFLWGDELATWSDAQATWDMAMFGLRIGQDPRCVVTMTPKPIKLLRDLLKREGDDAVVTRGSTFDNAANLAPPFLAAIRKRYEGTRLGRQELFADVLFDTPGALWQQAWIDRDRVQSVGIGDFKRIVVAIDPAVTSGENADETGIICAAIDDAGHAYILEDVSARLAPHEWAQAAIRLYKQYHADRIIGETNNGGEMIESVLRSIDPSVSYKSVHASRGKVVRAEPISALYEQGRVHHVGSFVQLEDQMCAFTSDFSRATAGYSPDRLDAMVWALTELMLEKRTSKFFFGSI
jgi:predicted phage terminase large subunit-like protein